MQSVVLKFYVTEKQRHRGELLYEWLLRRAQDLKLPGGSAFRAIAGFGKHGRLHDETFFELAGELPVAVEFLLDAGEADKLFAALRDEQLNLRFVRYTVESGMS